VSAEARDASLKLDRDNIKFVEKVLGPGSQGGRSQMADQRQEGSVGSYVILRRGGRILLAYVGDGSGGAVLATASANHWDLVRAVVGERRIPARLSNMGKIARAYISIRVLPYARDRARTADVIRNMDDFDAMFWRGAIMSHGMRAISAFRTLYDL